MVFKPILINGIWVRWIIKYDYLMLSYFIKLVISNKDVTAFTHLPGKNL